MTISDPIRILVVAAICLVACQINIAQEGAKDEIDSKRSSVKMLEIGKANDRSIYDSSLKPWKSLDPSVWSSWAPELGMVIINYGTDKEIARRENFILKALEKVRLYHARITVIRGGLCKPVGTIFWQVPRQAENPPVCEEPN